MIGRIIVKVKSHEDLVSGIIWETYIFGGPLITHLEVGDPFSLLRGSQVSTHS